MTKLKPIEQIAEDIKNKRIRPDTAVMLKLDSQKHNPVGYIWYVKPEDFIVEWDCPKELTIYPTSGSATSLPNDDVCREIDNRAVDISKGEYLGYKILGYETLMVKKRSHIR